ncbi:hypothetical protein DBB29_24825 [Pandoraea cepalis]|uniref:Transposase n=1 Tax=Pandoraea cepalis TaxID=2508294 RepID=A0AAW7MGU0_9BURK|nr:hypothetical protein [Pandoraea cepalis]MDN4581340.1 hypothetical protein [Pandoraea cepalis]
MEYRESRLDESTHRCLLTEIKDTPPKARVYCSCSRMKWADIEVLACNERDQRPFNYHVAKLQNFTRQSVATIVTSSGGRYCT